MCVCVVFSKYIYKSKTKYQLLSYFWSTLVFLDNLETP